MMPIWKYYGYFLLQNLQDENSIIDNGAKTYILEVEFPEILTTNYGKTLTFSQEMTGTAEIITEDLRLIDKFINPIKAVIKK